MKIITFIVIASITFSVHSQTGREFNGDKFPIHLINKNSIETRNLSGKLDTLMACDWKNRIGKKIDVFWLSTPKGDAFGHSFEYFMDCDNLRLIYWYSDPYGTGEIIDFMIENLEDESIWVVSKRKHLKNKKKYKKYLE